jgi:hypothetical protein
MGLVAMARLEATDFLERPISWSRRGRSGRVAIAQSNQLQWRLPMSRSKSLVGMIVLGMTLGASGCATTKASFSFPKLCKELNGTWDAATHACNGRPAQSACENITNGRYDRAAQTCDFSG